MAFELDLEDTIMERLRAQANKISKSEAAVQLGVDVTVHVAARVALLRGLDEMERGVGAVGSAVGVVEKADADVAEMAEMVVAVEKPGPDGWPIPEGWNIWSDGELLPEHHGDAHKYYIGHGWKRCWGMVGEAGKGQEAIVFYWSRDPDLQSLKPYNGVVEQKTPWGPGHLLPASFNG